LYDDLKAALDGSGIEPAAGPDAVVETAGWGAELTVAAIVGCAGLSPVMAAIRVGARSRWRTRNRSSRPEA
jgi:1-deoxy-D-xylulose-5-phosphate reductoisomerase